MNSFHCESEPLPSHVPSSSRLPKVCLLLLCTYTITFTMTLHRKPQITTFILTVDHEAIIQLITNYSYSDFCYSYFCLCVDHYVCFYVGRHVWFKGVFLWSKVKSLWRVEEFLLIQFIQSCSRNQLKFIVCLRWILPDLSPRTVFCVVLKCCLQQQPWFQNSCGIVKVEINHNVIICSSLTWYIANENRTMTLYFTSST